MNLLSIIENNPLINNILSWIQAYDALSLFILAFFEAICLPIPADTLLIATVLLSPENGFILSGVTALGSVIGGTAGYIIGAKGGKPILRKLFSKDKIEKAEHLISKYDVFAIGIAGFTPVPYQVFTLASGALSVIYIRFLLISLVTRTLRFYLVGTMVMIYGEPALELIKNYFDLFSIALVVKIILIFWFYNSIIRSKQS